MAAKDEDFEDELESEVTEHPTSEQTGDKRKRIFSKERKYWQLLKDIEVEGCQFSHPSLVLYSSLYDVWIWR